MFPWGQEGLNKNTDQITTLQSDYRKVILRLVRSGPLQRLARALLVAFGVMLVAFALIRFIPGDPAALILRNLATDEAIAELHVRMGIDGTLPEQLAAYLGNLLRGNLGESLISNYPVTALIAHTLPVTLWLIGVSFAMGLAFALPLGAVAAIYRHTWFGETFQVVNSMILATPQFFVALILLLVFALRFDMAPVAGYDPHFPANLYYLWLPALTMCTVLVPVQSRVLQSSISDTLEQEFVESAIVRGLPRRVLYWRYLIRPSIGPTISLVAYMMGMCLGSAVVIEMIFGLPGIGTLLIDAVTTRDYPLVQGIVMVFGLIIVALGYLSDTVSGLLDPRMRGR